MNAALTIPERKNMVVVSTFNVKPKSTIRVTKTRKVFVWSEDGEDFTIIDKTGKVIEGICSFTIEQMAEMFIQCAFDKINRLTALDTDRGRKIAAEINNVIMQLASGEISKIYSEPYKGIDFIRENNFLHMMLIFICRHGAKWKGYKSSAV